MPQQNTVAIPQRLPLIVGPENRDNSTAKDSRLINCFIERDESGEINLYRRPGMQLWINPGSMSQAGQGTYYWNGQVYSIFNGILYKNGTQIATGLDNAGGVYSFSSNMGANPDLVFQNGNQGYAWNDTFGLAGPLHTLSPSYPQYTVKGLSYLDGTMYVCQHFFGTSITPAVIWGSGINDVRTPGIWDPLNFITAQITPDSGVYLAKQLVYVVCMKEWSTEVFFDAGNATGSPLQNATNAKLNYGCASADSVQSINEVLLWISTNRSASNQIVLFDKLQMRVVSTKAIDRLLNQIDLTTVYSWQIKLNGHSFYVLTVKNANLTLAYDIDQEMWSQWTDASGNYVPIVASTRDGAGNHILQHETNGNLYFGSSLYTTDNGALIPITVITPEFDANTRRRKQLGAMFFVGDQVSGSSLGVSVSDDNYQTWSQIRTVDLGQKLPTLPQCGTFHKRAFKFTKNDSAAWRLSAVELQYDIGTL